MQDCSTVHAGSALVLVNSFLGYSSGLESIQSVLVDGTNQRIASVPIC